MSNSVLKGIVVATALSVGAISFATSAEAGGKHYYRYNHRHHGGNAAAAAILGFGLAAALANRPYYYSGPTYYSYGYTPYAYAPPRPYYGPYAYSQYVPGTYGPAPWTPEWYRYCAAKYLSFDRVSGTFQPFNGPRRLCQ